MSDYIHNSSRSYKSGSLYTRKDIKKEEIKSENVSEDSQEDLTREVQNDENLRADTKNPKNFWGGTSNSLKEAPTPEEILAAQEQEIREICVRAKTESCIKCRIAIWPQVREVLISLGYTASYSNNAVNIHG